MNVQCPQCETVFRVDPGKVPARGVRARCSVCAGVFFVERPGGPVPIGAVGPATTPPPATLAVPTAEPPSALPPPRQAAPAAPVEPAVAPATPVFPPTASPTGPVPITRPTTAAPAPAPPAVSPGIGAGPRVATAPAAPARGRMPPATPTARAGGAGAGVGAGRVINPFLSQDPDTRARRLARALISDLVVYNPAKRADGLRDGSLKMLFEDEIKKCWEEYTEQVGMEIASSTSYFTDALNEILADGRPVFP